YFCLATLSWKYSATIRQIFTSVIFIRTAAMLAVSTICAYILTIVLYLLYPNYFDHVQPVVASISWLWMHGYELYHDWTTGDVYILISGPLTFLMNGVMLFFSPSILASKLPGVLSLIVALAGTFILFKRATGSDLTSVFLSASLVALFTTL